MISDDLYDLVIAFTAILSVFALRLAGAENWLSVAIVSLSALLVVFKDHVLHRRVDLTRSARKRNFP